MQFCLCVSNNVLHVFSLKFASFSRYYVCEKKHIFARASSGDLLLDEKQKKPFVSLSDQVTIIPNALTTASLAQADKALNGPDSNLFCRDTSSIRGRSIFFSVLFLYFFQKSRYLFKKMWHFLTSKVSVHYISKGLLATLKDNNLAYSQH